ncbi:MAG: hypothetical protein AB7H85_12855 [Dehalococcoidia bacterium]
MSKAIAQPASGKRFAWLLALVAVFALLAGAQLSVKSADAASTGAGLSQADTTIGDPLPQFPPGAEDEGLTPGLYHVSPDGDSLLTIRDEERNLIGWDHTVCLVVARDGEGDVINANEEIYEDLLPTGVGGILPLLGNDAHYNWSISTIGGGSANVIGAVKLELSFEQYDNNTGDELPCVRWTSTQPGEQNVTVVDETGSVAADWADNTGPVDICLDDDNNDNCNNLDGVSGLNPAIALVKEWNVLDRTTITYGGADVTNGVTSRPTVFNPATSTYEYFGQVDLVENVYGTHQAAGGVVNTIVVGARVTFTATGTCGVVIVDPNGTTTYPNVPPADNDGEGPLVLFAGESATVYSIGVGIPFTIDTDGCFARDSWTGVSISTAYPALIGSVQPAPAIETFRVNWAPPEIASKKIMLAWAGQRVIIEKDWRLPADSIPQLWFGPEQESPVEFGDAFCPFNAGLSDEFFVVKYLKGGGPGNFLDIADFHNIGALPDLILDLISVDEANVFVHDFDCISRIAFESEQPGQVDIEAYVIDHLGCEVAGQFEWDREGIGAFCSHDGFFDAFGELNQTKSAFVIYYMKFEDVKVGLVTSVSKPTHNSSWAGWSDYAPGNPWDASTDVTSTSWNVSKDLLVRGRVRGWFLNENPSGRARDDSDPLNVKPADRWIMPTDWALLAGGPADPADGSDATGTAEQFRPYYDLMIAPNNVKNLALAGPDGGTLTSGSTDAIVAQVVAWPAGGKVGSMASNNSTPFAVSSTANIFVGTPLLFPTPGVSPAAGTCITAPALTFVTAISPILNGVGNTVGVAITVAPKLCSTPAAGTNVWAPRWPFHGPLSLIDHPTLGLSAAPSPVGFARDTIWADGDVDMWDAPMPVAPVSIKLRGAGFLKQVIKEDVYYNGTANSTSQTYPNPYYYTAIPAEPWIPAVVAGGGFIWDTWFNDGLYHFWELARRDANIAGIGEGLTNTQMKELQNIRDIYGDQSITRDAVVYSDNHGEFMVTANGDFNLDYSGCATNSLAGGKHCKPGDVVGKASIMATVDYPDFRGKHFPVASNTVTVDWTWGGYKDVTVEDGETPQFKYIVFHAMDRDGWCNFAYTTQGTVGLHPVLTSLDALINPGAGIVGYNDPDETVDFLIDSGQGIVVGQSGGALNKDGNRQFATGVPTFSTAVNTTLKEFPFSAHAAAGATDECQAWVKVSNSLLGIVDFLVVAHNDEGDVGFDRVVDLQTTATYSLNFRWSLITWNGADNIAVADALKGTGANDTGNDIFDQVTAIYGWEQQAQDWLGFFPAGVSVPGANDLVTLKTGQAYWIAIKAPGPVSWTYATNVD